MVAIGFGGHTTSGSDYPSEISVITNERIACSDHEIDPLPGRIWPGVAELDGWLYVCGGNPYNVHPLTDCQKFDLTALDGKWISAPPLPKSRREFTMITHRSSIYAYGGYNTWCCTYSEFLNSMYEFNHASNAWTSKATLPYQVIAPCSISDLELDRLWMIAGHLPPGVTGDVYFYTVGTNKWTYHSNLGQTMRDAACGIIKRHDGARWIIVVKGSNLNNAVIYYDLTKSVGWTFLSAVNGGGGQNSMNMLVLSPFSALLVGGYTTRYGHSLWNFYEFNQNQTRFEEGYYKLQNEMHWGAWATVQRSNYFRAFQNCVTLRKYAAVGWGGEYNSTYYPPWWSVLLRDRWTSPNYMRRPASCHRIIPDLSPGRFAVGVTAVDYLLMVCGGHVYQGKIENICYSLDTNSDMPLWNIMDGMLMPRAYYELITYGDAAFAIAGYNGVTAIPNVDRWTSKNGWQAMASYPLSVDRLCAVADEGRGRIFSMGGANSMGVVSRSFYYTVSTNTWTELSGLYWAAANIACGIIRRRRTGNRMLLVTGDNVSRTQWMDLTRFDNTGESKWNSFVGPEYANYYATIVSLSPYESYEVKYCKILY